MKNVLSYAITRFKPKLNAELSLAGEIALYAIFS